MARFGADGCGRWLPRVHGQGGLSAANGFADQGEVVVGLAHNMMLAADPATGEIRRFLTGPAGCEITGATGTPDGRTMFVNIQHPGESPSERSDPAAPTRFSNGPDKGANRPRSATVVIRRATAGTAPWS